MAEYTEGLISIEKIVTQFMLSYKKTTEDYVSYLSHALNCVQSFNLYDGNLAVTAKVTLNTTLKCIEMPTDMLSFIDLVTPLDGGWWSFTEKNIVNTTTTTGGVEGRDDTQGEGHLINQDRVVGYCAKGGYNRFKYTIDWVARRIYVDDVYDSDTKIVLIYVSSGIKATGETAVPAFLIPLIDNYLLEKETFWIPELVRERPMRHDAYWREKLAIRDLVNSMSESSWHDLFLEGTTQTIQR
jgi:hypothetical protein